MLRDTIILFGDIIRPAFRILNRAIGVHLCSVNTDGDHFSVTSAVQDGVGVVDSSVHGVIHNAGIIGVASVMLYRTVLALTVFLIIGDKLDLPGLRDLFQSIL